MADGVNKLSSMPGEPEKKENSTPRDTVFPSSLKISTTLMHTGGEPFRIIETGFPEPEGTNLLQKRAWIRARADHYRKLLMFEPRGHFDMYGALLVTPDLPEADLGVIFMHNEGYSTMCGHAIIALGRQVLKLLRNPIAKIQ
jgi:trans-L-3-hydroxyproline dehydratase